MLQGVQKDSAAVWKSVSGKNSLLGDEWFKATVQINASADSDWFVHADNEPIVQTFQFETRR